MTKVLQSLVIDEVPEANAKEMTLFVIPTERSEWRNLKL